MCLFCFLFDVLCICLISVALLSAVCRFCPAVLMICSNLVIFAYVRMIFRLVNVLFTVVTGSSDLSDTSCYQIKLLTNSTIFYYNHIPMIYLELSYLSPSSLWTQANLLTLTLRVLKLSDIMPVTLKLLSALAFSRTLFLSPS